MGVVECTTGCTTRGKSTGDHTLKGSGEEKERKVNFERNTGYK
jgi:hypothetical protein